VGSTTVIGLAGIERLISASGGAAAGVVTVGVMVLVVGGALADRPGRPLIIAARLGSAAYFAMPCFFPPAGGTFPPEGADAFDLPLGGRYSILPSLLLFTALLLSVTAIARRARRRGAEIALAIAVVPVAVWAVTDYCPISDLRPPVPTWSKALEQLRRDWAAGAPSAVPIEPGGQWHVQVSCARVDV
jgi:hypothetical protein